MHPEDVQLRPNLKPSRHIRLAGADKTLHPWHRRASIERFAERCDLTKSRFFEPQRGEITKPRLKAWVNDTQTDTRAPKRRNNPFQSHTYRMGVVIWPTESQAWEKRSGTNSEPCSGDSRSR